MSLIPLAQGCIIPDRDIVVILEHPCGEEWIAQTVGAYGYNGLGEQEPVKTEDDEWISKHYCVSQAQSELLANPSSEIADTFMAEVSAECTHRALTLGLADNDDTCVGVAHLAWIGECQNPDGGCDQGADEADVETGDDTEGTEDDSGDTETSDAITLADLELSDEVIIENGAYVVSERLISVADSDIVGLMEDGTTATQLVDDFDEPYAFEISGVRSDNLGGVLGLKNGDRVTAIDGWPTTNLESLLSIAGHLEEAEQSTIELERDGTVMTVTYRRR
ncbi:hypothetical protein G6O69_11055 [Pseudenhygromyxa sp. WMMC2535]|uniref:hypothetical protein n=1 Tax=Pseudenhygromyxa sp. WMMC2535 TaxID=2712867 RepID=UPI001552CC8B|nr:hypothetical protein [Pseudenhygromyxa sp. WMMC2535]NVB38369.1 hypothetical protein [Pseudenhygromyxa sp. WMMC2535]